MFRLGLLRALTSSAQTPILPMKEGVPDVGISSKHAVFCKSHGSKNTQSCVPRSVLLGLALLAAVLPLGRL